MTAGPQIQPWTCFAGALDAQCNTVRRPSPTPTSPPAAGRCSAYDPDNPPTDVATTDSDSGKTVPFIVRQETGTLDRDQYRIAALYDPGKPSAPWATQDGINHRLVIFHGASAATPSTSRPTRPT